MSNIVNVMAIVEGATEAKFIVDVLAPYLANKNIFITGTRIGKPGQKGGNVKFSRLSKDIGNFLKQRTDNYVTLLIDFYGTTDKEWPGLVQAKAQNSPKAKADTLNQATLKEVEELFGEHTQGRRFIPYISMHEFEALLFSDAGILARGLNISKSRIEDILTECGEPEKINDSKNTAPSKRLEILKPGYGKTTTGIGIAETIGIQKMRDKCPLFNAWLNKLESLTSN